MKIVIIHGQSHKGSTYHIARQVADKIGGEITEFFLPKDFGEFCVGCTSCFVKGKENCPHYSKLHPITDALLAADVIILESPVYVFHATGAMKAFLDHFGYMWMAHRPEEAMFSKQGVCIATAAGAGMKSTVKDMADSLFNWGVAKIYKYGLGIAAVDWNGVSDKKKEAIDKTTTKIANSIKQNHGKVKPGIKLKMSFELMRMIQVKWGWNPMDVDYWTDKGWTGKMRPWTSSVERSR